MCTDTICFNDTYRHGLYAASFAVDHAMMMMDFFLAQSFNPPFHVCYYTGKTCEYAAIAKHIPPAVLITASDSGVRFRGNPNCISGFCVSAGCRASRQQRSLRLPMPTTTIHEGYCRRIVHDANNLETAFRAGIHSNVSIS